MDTPRYHSLALSSLKHGDDFFKCLSLWLSDPSNTKERASCLKQGRRYEVVLTEQIQYLKSIPRTGRVVSAIRICEKEYSVLGSQIKLLEAPR